VFARAQHISTAVITSVITKRFIIGFGV